MPREAAGGAPTDLRAAGTGSRFAYLPGLDGLRAVAVVAVLLYHADIPWAVGGFLGVEVFFVISGYLITSLLLEEWQARGRLDIPAFWLRRARRLLPALFAMIAATLGFALVFLPNEVAGMRSDALAAAGYVTNWYLIFSHKPYFETIGRPPLLQHLWSLAVEEQFYLAWPVLFAVGMRLVRRRGMLLGVLAGAVGASALMASLYVPDVDPSRIYYGTDTRAAGLLLGAGLALGFDPRRLAGWARRAVRVALDAAGLVGLGVLGWAFLRLDEFQPFLYQGGFGLVALATLTALAAVAAPGSHIAGVIGRQPLRWIGQRSYSIYLWHWPVLMVSRPQLDVRIDGPVLLGLQLAAIAALAELSYRYVEMPIRRGDVEQAWRAMQSADGPQRRWLRLGWASGAAGLLSLLVALCLAVADARPPGPPAYLSADAVDPAAAEAANLPDVIGSPAPISEPESTPTPPSPPATPEIQLVTAPTASPPASSPAAGADAASGENAKVDAAWLRARAAERWSHQAGVAAERAGVAAQDAAGGLPPSEVKTGAAGGSEVKGISEVSVLVSELPGVRAGPGATPVPERASLHAQLAAPENDSLLLKSQRAAPTPDLAPAVIAIGDSVMLSSSRELRKALGDVVVDAVLGRQVSAAINLLRTRRDAGLLASTVVIHLGNNGTFSARQFDEIMQVLAGVPRVIFVTVRVPRKWEDVNNEVLTDGVRRYSNTTLLDWRTASEDDPDLFYDDGTHLRPKGAKLYAGLIAESVASP